MGGTNNEPQTGTKKIHSSGPVSLRDKQLTKEIVAAFQERLHSNRNAFSLAPLLARG